MKRRRAISVALVFALVQLLYATMLSAQSNAGAIVIGLLDAGERPEEWAAFRQRLRELGYVEGRNVSFVLR